jgi:hypothetical protein
MLTRRALTTAAIALPLAACAPGDAYAQAVSDTWRLVPPAPGFPVQALVHAATLAANGHNTQAWRFSASGARIRISPDLSRRTPVVDPDDHHLFVGLGCAAETLLQAAPVYGWRGEVESVTAADGVVLAFTPGPVGAGPMSAAIPLRASTRSVYDGRAVPAAQLSHLVQAAGDQVGLTLITDRPRLGQATDFILRGNAAQVRDPAFRRELEAWIRFSPSEALARRDGLFAASSGNPMVPRFIGERVFGLAFTEQGETDRIQRQMRSSAGLAVFTGPAARAEAWVEAGRAFTRFALAATAAGMKLAFLNQPVEDVATRGDFAGWLGLGAARPDLVVRFGYGPALPRSLRRPVARVLQAP